MKNIKLHSVSIALIAYSVFYFITNDAASVSNVFVYITLALSLAIANSLAAFFPKKEKVIWVLCYIFFAGLVLFELIWM